MAGDARHDLVGAPLLDLAEVARIGVEGAGQRDEVEVVATQHLLGEVGIAETLGDADRHGVSHRPLDGGGVPHEPAGRRLRALDDPVGALVNPTRDVDQVDAARASSCANAAVSSIVSPPSRYSSPISGSRSGSQARRPP